MNNQRGVIHLLPLLLVVAAVIGVVYLVTQGVIKLPVPSLPGLDKGPKVELKTEYQNPFEKESQYVNPFSKYKNPFVVNR